MLEISLELLIRKMKKYDTVELANSFSILGSCYTELNQFEDAILNLLKSYEMHRRLNYGQDDFIRSVMNLAYFYFRTGDQVLFDKYRLEYIVMMNILSNNDSILVIDLLAQQAKIYLRIG